jgi:hypothetical protein
MRFRSSGPVRPGNAKRPAEAGRDFAIVSLLGAVFGFLAGSYVAFGILYPMEGSGPMMAGLSAPFVGAVVGWLTLWKAWTLVKRG